MDRFSLFNSCSHFLKLSEALDRPRTNVWLEQRLTKLVWSLERTVGFATLLVCELGSPALEEFGIYLLGDIVVSQLLLAFSFADALRSWFEGEYKRCNTASAWQFFGRACLNLQSCEGFKLAATKDIIIPAVIPEYVTKRVLAMEYVKGVKITDYATCLKKLWSWFMMLWMQKSRRGFQFSLPIWRETRLWLGRQLLRAPASSARRSWQSSSTSTVRTKLDPTMWAFQAHGSGRSMLKAIGLTLLYFFHISPTQNWLQNCLGVPQTQDTLTQTTSFENLLTALGSRVPPRLLAQASHFMGRSSTATHIQEIFLLRKRQARCWVNRPCWNVLRPAIIIHAKFSILGV